MGAKITDINVDRYERIFSPKEMCQKYPATPDIERHILRSRETFNRILRDQDARLTVVVGPCSIHDYDEAVVYANKLAKLSKDLKKLHIIMRVYFEKPRTTVGWRGLVSSPGLDAESSNTQQGLETARKLLLEINSLNLACATEFIEPTVAQHLSDLITWAAIGARSTEHQTARALASVLSHPAGIKNGTSGNIQVAVDAVIASKTKQSFFGVDRDGNPATVHTNGNHNTHIILRGGGGQPNYDENSVKLALNLLKKQGLREKLMIDCSHGNSNKSLDGQKLVIAELTERIREGDKSIFGLMIESNLESGRQDCIGAGAVLLPGVSITDPCIGFSDTEDLLVKLNRAVVDRNYHSLPACQKYY